MASTPMGKSFLKYTSPSVSSGPIVDRLLDQDGALVEALVRARRWRGPSRVLPIAIGQLIDDGPRCAGSSEG